MSKNEFKKRLHLYFLHIIMQLSLVGGNVCSKRIPAHDGVIEEGQGKEWS